MVERDDTYKAFDLALRVGEILLSSGAGAADVTATMLAVTRACGMRGVTTDVTYTDLTLHHQPSPDAPAAIHSRHVTRREVDYETLAEVDLIVRDLMADQVTREEARDRVAHVVSTGHGRQRWAVTLGWGLMGAGVAVTLGGDATVLALSFLAACAIDRTQRTMARRRIPPFYQQVAGAAVATLIAVAATATQIQANPSRVITAGIVMLLAGIGVMGATQDAITGFPVTASARLLDALLATTGIIGGVSAGLSIGRLLGVELGTFNPGEVGLQRAGLMVIGAALAATSFAFASYAPRRSLLLVAAVGGLGQAVWIGVDQTGLGTAFATTVAAVAVGAACALSARFRVPPLVIVVPAIVPLLPGLSIYRGLALLSDGKDGIPDLAAAAATAIALAAGVILGQYLSQPLRREAHWLETRLSGPRLVGPLLGRHVAADPGPLRGPPAPARRRCCPASALPDQVEDDAQQHDHHQRQGRARLVDQGGERERHQDDDRGDVGHDQQPRPGAGLVPDPEVAEGDQREDDQGDGAADRRDGVEVEEHGQDDRGGRGDDDADGARPPTRRPITGGNCPTAAISSPSPAAG